MSNLRRKNTLARRLRILGRQFALYGCLPIARLSTGLVRSLFVLASVNVNVDEVPQLIDAFVRYFKHRINCVVSPLASLFACIGARLLDQLSTVELDLCTRVLLLLDLVVLVLHLLLAGWSKVVLLDLLLHPMRAWWALASFIRTNRLV